MNLRSTTFIARDREIFVLPSSSTFTIKHSEIPKLVLYLIKEYLGGLCVRKKKSANTKH
jgi:hypothetical protein